MSQSRPTSERYQEALRFLYDRINYERMASETARYPFRLHRTYELLRRLDLEGYLYESGKQSTKPPSNPPVVPTVPLVHIAGTKGKGSTATMLASILTAAGLRTGLYTSPHLNDLEERFRIDGQACSHDQFSDLVDHVSVVACDLEAEDHGSPSFFELTTAIAILHFHTQKCDAVVLEVGLGGRLDSTNVCAPSVTAITSIGLDHQHVLGDTLAEIAAEKAGILKPSVPVISGVRGGEAAEVIGQHAGETGCKLFQLGRDFDFESSPSTEWGSSLRFQGTTPPLSQSIKTVVPLEGSHQSQNAALAVAIATVLRQQGVPITDQSVHDGLRQTQCRARIERFRLPGDVTVIVDAAHNDDSVGALCDCLDTRFGDRQKSLAVVFGTSRDKSATSMLDRLVSSADELVLTQFQGNPRFTKAADLLPIADKTGCKNVQVIENPIDACRKALESVSPGGTMVVCGSFFLAAETRPWVIEQSIKNESSCD